MSASRGDGARDRSEDDQDGRTAGPALPALLTIEQVAAWLQVSPRTVRRLRIPCVRVGRLVRYQASDIARFLAARRSHA